MDIVEAIRSDNDDDDAETTGSRVGAMVLIFAVSLLAASFPSVSKRVTYIHIPQIIFYIAKHFGTGIILATAFAHLLQDAYTALQDPAVKELSRVGRWTGMIVLSSLLLIFFVEYISTAYVDHLHSQPSRPTSPSTEATVISSEENHDTQSERTPLLRSPTHPHVHPHTQEFPCISGMNKDEQHQNVNIEEAPEELAESIRSLDDVTVESQEPKTEVGRRRQVIGILILQVGIMIHSVVIGLTLSITTGSQFASLLAAVSFHQIFEGLSLGIRIAGLPSPRKSRILSRFLKPILAFLFAITPPLGVVIGLIFFAATENGSARMKLVKGVTSALSAGMLIYASTTEMLAGDFVMDRQMWRSPVYKQIVALLSLAAGVFVMGVLIT